MRRCGKARYRSILANVNEFDRDDRFLVNILSGAMLAAVYIGLSKKPDVDTLGQYYEKAMDTALMRRFLAHKNHYTANAQAKLKQSAERSRTRTPNPYSWVFDYTPGPDINSYTATFYTCGLCHLLKSLGIAEGVSTSSNPSPLALSPHTRERRTGGRICARRIG